MKNIKIMPKQVPSFNLSWTPDELKNGGFEDITNKIAKLSKTFLFSLQPMAMLLCLKDNGRTATIPRAIMSL